MSKSAQSQFQVITAEDTKHEKDITPLKAKDSSKLEMGKVNWNDISPARFAALTWASSVVEVGLTYPAWVMKTRQQIQKGTTSTSTKTALKEAWVSSGRSVSKVGRLFYRGYGTYITLAMPAYVLYTGAYTWSKSELGFVSGYREDEKLPNIWVALSPLAAGLAADFVCLSTYVPVELVTQKVQVSNTAKAPVRQIFSDVHRKNGLRGFYRGFGATLVTSGIASGVIWMTYEHTKKVLQKSVEKIPSYEKHRNALNAASAMCAGSFAMVVADVVSNPLDVVKTRIQVSNQSGSFSSGLKELFRKEGIRGAFSRGLGPRLIQAVPLGALSSVTYEAILYLSSKDMTLQTAFRSMSSSSETLNTKAT